MNTDCSCEKLKIKLPGFRPQLQTLDLPEIAETRKRFKET